MSAGRAAVRDRTVLIVDDDEALRESLAEILSLEGIATVSASSGRLALDLFAAVSPAVVIVDYQLPDSSGTELAHAIKSASGGTPVLMLTGFPRLETAAAAVGKLDGYLLKPVQPASFLQAVQEALTASRTVSESRDLVERLQQANTYQAHYDGLTGLPNRALLNDEMEQSLETCRQKGRGMAVLFIDLDGFKVVNDLFGHHVGDQLLQQLAKRLKERARGSFSAARFGGDEFIVIDHELEEPADACLLAARLIDDLSEPVVVDGTEHSLSASIGIALASPESLPSNAAAMLRNADIAMYRAKEAGRGRWELFDDTMRQQVTERFEIERGLRRALEEGGFFLEYQPIVCPHTAALAGAEALIRWNRPGHGRQAPADFLGVAESSGLIAEVGRWVLDEALSELARWQTTGGLPADFCLWVNVAPQQLADPDFASVVSDCLERHQVRPGLLGLEILEEGLLDMKVTQAVLAQLRAIGMSVNLDDFGAGHSNLALLQELPITGLKIDRRFVAGLGDSTEQRGAAIVSGLVNLGHSLGLTVVAEGVETKAESEAVLGIGCELAQGYFYGPPGPAELLWQIVEPA